MRWISVKDELPSCHDRILVSCYLNADPECTIKIVRIAHYTCGSEMFDFPFNDGREGRIHLDCDYVTHWMYMPSAAKDDE